MGSGDNAVEPRTAGNDQPTSVGVPGTADGSRLDRNSGDHAFLLVASLAKALAHKIRTPLTVVTNELSYLATQGSDCERAVQRSKDIAAVLKLACALGSAAPRRDERLDLTTTVKRCFPDVTAAPFFVNNDAMRLDASLRLLSAMRNDLADEESPTSSSTALTVSGANATLTMRCKLHDEISVDGEFSSLTALFSEKLHLDLIEPPLIDVGASLCGIRIRCTLKEGIFILHALFEGEG
jgi:hypothetical protein